MATAVDRVSPGTIAAGARFHLSLNVGDLTRSVAFFRAFFGVEPAKCRDDYAKFELNDPPLVLSLEPVAPRGAGALNHLGFRVPDAASLVELQRRLESHGVSTQREEGVECCYARQTKFWLHDPDGNLWEVYTLDEDIPDRGMPPQAPSLPQVDARPPDERTLAIWAHRLGQSIPERLYVQPGSVDEARLQGTFNARCPAEARARLLSQVFQSLRPGGKLVLHHLTSDRPAPENLSLPGPAAAVEFVPVISELVREVEEAGFISLQFDRFADAPCFVVNGAQMRETMLTAEKPNFNQTQPSFVRRVMYKGPFPQITLDGGRILRRGEFVHLDTSAIDSIAPAARGQLAFCDE